MKINAINFLKVIILTVYFFILVLIIVSGIDFSVPVAVTVNSVTTVSLNQGWNLISIPLVLKNNSIESVLADIIDKIIIVNSFDGGVLSYNPKLPMFSDLHEIDHLHGYWIKVNETVNLTTSGTIPENKTINLLKSWNQISYLCNETKNIEYVFANIMDKVIVINGFENGAKTYDPKLPEFSDLKEMKPNLGYWVKMNETTILDYNNIC